MTLIANSLNVNAGEDLKRGTPLNWGLLRGKFGY